MAEQRLASTFGITRAAPLSGRRKHLGVPCPLRWQCGAADRKESIMRRKMAILITAALIIGCQRIDANRGNPVPDEPTARSDRGTRPEPASRTESERATGESPASTPAAPVNSTSSSAQPDNTAVNQRDTSPGA